MTVILGILCLGLIIFIHELGHFIAARLCGVKVESFSIGMGPVLFHKTVGETDYRISLLPFGGYCGMKGEQAFRDALENNLDMIPKEEGGFYAVHPLKRVTIALAGPCMNLLFAIIAFSLISMIGYTYYSANNQVIMADEIYPDIKSVSHESGLETGDIVLSINNIPVETFSDISEIVGTNPEVKLNFEILRDNEILNFELEPILDTETGLGKIGVLNWIDPIIEQVETDSLASKAGILPKDKIISINNIPIRNTAEIRKNIYPNDYSTIQLERIIDGEIKLIETNFFIKENEPIGLQFYIPKHEAKKYSFFPAIFHGIKESGEMIGLTLKSISLLFKGINLSNAVSGPVRITVMLGDTVQTGFSAGFRTGLVSTLNFLALISISLFIMNLLPIPILDGGLVLFGLIEAIIRKPIHPKVMYYTQFIGLTFIFILLGIAIFSDANFIIRGINQ